MKKTASTDLRQFVREEAQKLHKITMLEEQKKSAEFELKILNEEFEGEQEQEDINEMQDIPDVENDCFIDATPSGGYNIACAGKFMGNHETVEDCLKIIKSYIEDSGFQPNVWFVSDHGNFSPIDLEGNIIKETKGVKSMYKNAGMTPPKGKGIHTKKFHKCVTSVGEKGDVDNPYAVCMSSLGKEKAVKAAHRTDENISSDNETLTYEEVFNIAKNAGEIILDAQTALYSLLIGFEENEAIPKDRVLRILANYDIDLDEVNHETKSGGEEWHSLDQLADMGLI